MDMSLAEMEGHARTHKQARPIFDSGRDDENKQGQRGEQAQQSLVRGRNNIHPHVRYYLFTHLQLR